MTSCVLSPDCSASTFGSREEPKVLDEVRREEWNKARAELAKEKKEKFGRGRPKGGKKQKSSAEQRVEAVKSSKYSLLMNPENLSETYQTKLK